MYYDTYGRTISDIFKFLRYMDWRKIFGYIYRDVKF